MNLSDRTINPLTTKRAYYMQGENSALPYTIDYAAYLQGDTIVSSEWSCKQAITLAPSNTASTTTVTVQGGPGKYAITNKIETSAGVIDERTLVVEITADDAAGGYE